MEERPASGRRRLAGYDSRVSWPGDGTFIETVYFTSESDARAAESAEPMSDEDRAASERLLSLLQMERFVDLADPWLASR